MSDKDVDTRLGAESMRLIREMNALIERGRVLLRDRQQALRASAGPAIAEPGTLGAVLYACPSRPVETEKEWLSLVRAIAARDPLALQALYERTREPVRTLIERIAGEREAESVTLEVFRDIRRQADRYDAEGGTVLAWVMNLAQARARGRAMPAGEARALPVFAATPQWSAPPWQEVAAGISVKMLVADEEQHRVGMLVRLVPGGEYPPHTHAGVEELHLLEGELWIDERKLYPGAYNRAEPGTGDKRVWSETGCSCVLITSTRDVLR